MMDFFEGREKTVRVYFRLPECRTLLDLETGLWAKLLARTGCSIIGELRQKDVTAYLLSESSLFVWRDHIVLKTCGTTTPLLLLPMLQEELEWLEGYEWFSYTNGAFLRPQLQPHGYRSKEEMELLITNTLLRLATKSPADCSGASLSLSDGSFQSVSQSAKQTSATLPIIEIKLTKLQECGQFYSAPDNVAIEKMFSNLFNETWETDHFHFEPCGFSLNALQPESEESYATIHVTPEHDFSYVSFETNCPKELKGQLKNLLFFFCPREVVITAQFQNRPLDSKEKGEKCSSLHDLVDQIDGFEFELECFEEHVLDNLKIVSYRYNFPQLEW